MRETLRAPPSMHTRVVGLQAGPPARLRRQGGGARGRLGRGQRARAGDLRGRGCLGQEVGTIGRVETLRFRTRMFFGAELLDFALWRFLLLHSSAFLHVVEMAGGSSCGTVSY